MKLSLVPALALLVAAFTGVQAQNVSQCILDCFGQAETNNGCVLTDTKCTCTNPKVQQESFACLQQSCTAQDVQNSEMLFQSECAGFTASSLSSSDPSATASPPLSSSSTLSLLQSETRSASLSLSSKKTTQPATPSHRSDVPSELTSSSTSTTSDDSKPSYSTSTNTATTSAIASESESVSLSSPIPDPPPPTSSILGSTIPTVTLVPPASSQPPTATSTPTTTAQSRLGAGAVAGIAVGASALTAIGLVSASFLYAMRRKQRATAAACASDPPAASDDPRRNSNAWPLPRAGVSESSYPCHGGGGNVLRIFEEGLTVTDGDPPIEALSRAQASYATSNAPSEFTAPPPYCHQNRAPPLDKPEGGLRDEEVVPELGEAPGPLATWSMAPNGAVTAAESGVVFSANGITHYTHPAAQRTPSPRRVSEPVGGMFVGEEGGADPSDQRGTSDASTLPPPYS